MTLISAHSDVHKAGVAVPQLERTQGSTFRFSGHQTFPLRIAWIPKAVRALVDGDDLFGDIDKGISKLGLGKNMIEALRCWIEAFQVARRQNGKLQLTPIGKMVFHPESGLDPCLEDVSTAWLLHWLISTDVTSPFFAWECLINRWASSEFSASDVISAFQSETRNARKPASAVTLKQHWEVFLHSYRQTPSGKGEEQLDSAMSVLRLVRGAGERLTGDGNWEPLYCFDSGQKTSISQELFTFFVHDWWNRELSSEQTVPLRELAVGAHSPGRVLKMHESEVLDRMSLIVRRQSKMFQMIESVSLRQVRRLLPADGVTELRAAYKSPSFLYSNHASTI